MPGAWIDMNRTYDDLYAELQIKRLELDEWIRCNGGLIKRRFIEAEIKKLERQLDLIDC